MGHCLVVEALGQMMSNKVENEFFHSRGKVPRKQPLKQEPLSQLNDSHSSTATRYYFLV
jgi:hypothetical protein